MPHHVRHDKQIVIPAKVEIQPLTLILSFSF